MMKLKKTAKPMTIEDHIELGQAIKNVLKDIDHVLKLINKHDLCYKTDTGKLIIHCERLYDEFRCVAEDKMFREHPHLDNRAISVYYHDNETVTIDDLL